MRTAQITMLSTADISVDQTTQSQNIEQIFSYSVQVNFLSGSPAGTLKLQGSIDGTHFADISGTTTTISSTGTTLFNIPDAAYQYFRVTFTHSMGSTGTMTVLCFIKGF